MKRTVITMTAVLAVLILAILFGAPKAQSFNSAAAIAAPVPAALAVPMPERRCPTVDDAIHSLEVAERDMRDARHDFCGHKREALEATHRAIEQLRLAETCARCQ